MNKDRHGAESYGSYKDRHGAESYGSYKDRHDTESYGSYDRCLFLLNFLVLQLLRI